jgi:hypothetical protein
MATEKQPKKKKKASTKSADKPAKPAAEQPEAAGQSDAQPEMRSALLPLLWLLIPFATVVVYGLLTKE